MRQAEQICSATRDIYPESHRQGDSMKKTLRSFAMQLISILAVCLPTLAQAAPLLAFVKSLTETERGDRYCYFYIEQNEEECFEFPLYSEGHLLVYGISHDALYNNKMIMLDSDGNDILSITVLNKNVPSSFLGG
jgi:hypothetical protein